MKAAQQISLIDVMISLVIQQTQTRLIVIDYVSFSTTMTPWIDSVDHALRTTYPHLKTAGNTSYNNKYTI